MRNHTTNLLSVATALFATLLPAVAPAAEQPLSPSDKVVVTISGVPLADTQMISAGSPYTLGDDGRIGLAYLGTVKAEGMRPSELARVLESAYVNAQIYQRPSVQVTIDTQSTNRLIYVSGEVKSPAGIEYRNGMTVFNAITACGGPTDFADMRDIKLIRTEGGRTITIPVDLKNISRGGVDPVVKPNDRIILPN